VHGWLLRRDVFFTFPTAPKWPKWGKEFVSLVGEGTTRGDFVTSPIAGLSVLEVPGTVPDGTERILIGPVIYPQFGLIYP